MIVPRRSFGPLSLEMFFGNKTAQCRHNRYNHNGKHVLTCGIAHHSVLLVRLDRRTHRGYKKSSKAFDRVKPFEPAFWIGTCEGCCRGRGAWELTTGYSYVDLEDGVDVSAGTEERAYVDGLNVGLNWYLNPYSRVMFNYNYEDTDFVNAGTPDSQANIFGGRWQVDW